MSEQKRIPWTKLVASASCATALGTYFALAPIPVNAQGEGDCIYAGQAYSSGACRGGQRCDGGTSRWFDDSTCPAGAE